MIKAQYTVVLKTLLDDEHCKEAIDKAMSTYPLYKKTRTKDEYIPTYIPTREELNKKILNRYKYREIGFDSVGRFIDELEIALNEIMPYYNQLFFSTDQDYNLLYNVDYVREFTGTKDAESNVTNENTIKQTSSGKDTSSNTSETTTESETTSYSKTVEVDTPQNEMNVPAQNLESLDYASKVDFNKTDASDSGKTTGSSNVTSNSEGTNNTDGTSETVGTNKEDEQHTEIVKGNYGQVSFQRLLEHYRELIINVEQQIIEDRRIAELFLQVY